MKNAILNILIVIICGAMLSASLLIPVSEAETVDPQVLDTAQAEYLRRDVYVDGQHYFNWGFIDPVVRINGMIYVPVNVSALIREEKTDRIGELSGASIIVPQLQEKAVYSVSEDSDPAPVEPGLEAVCTQMLPYNCDHEFNGFQVTTGFKDLFGQHLFSTTDIAVSESGVYYASEEFLRNALGIDVCFREPGGVYISTDPAVSASRWADSDTNASYIEGVKWYIMVCGQYLSIEEAEYYEFLIRHVAAQLENVSPKLLFGVIYVESHFDTRAGTGAVGLMQVLLKYASTIGYTREMLEDPHMNMEYGGPMLDSYIGQLGGDVTRALAAYNQGISAVRNNPNPDTWYADLVYKWMANLDAWLAENDYCTEFVDKLVLKEQ